MVMFYAGDQLIDVTYEDDDYDPPAWKRINCQNCGAIVEKGEKECRYCGSSRQLRKDLKEVRIP